MRTRQFSTRTTASALALLGAMLGQAAFAVPCTSTGTWGADKTVTATLSPTLFNSMGSTAADGCTVMQQGNLAHEAADLPLTLFGTTWYLVQKDVGPSDSGGALSFTSDAGNKNGTWTIDTSKTTATRFLVGLKPDGGFAYFNVGGATSGTYSALSHGLSHGNLYGEVPIPAAAWLFGSGLIGLAGIARKRKAS